LDFQVNPNLTKPRKWEEETLLLTSCVEVKCLVYRESNLSNRQRVPGLKYLSAT
jgi:hypothetical protein